MPDPFANPAAFVPALSLALTLAVSLGACAHGAQIEAPETPHGGRSPSQDDYRLHEISEFPQYTPDEVGRRFLKMAKELSSATDLTPALYESAEPFRDEIGRPIQLSYRRNDIHLSITERREADAPDPKFRRACAERIVIAPDRG